eukprot:1060684-Rhodomonas_salina.1
MIAARGADDSDEATRQKNENKQKSAEEAHQAWLQEQARIERLEIVEEEVYALYDLVELGMIEDLAEKAFPPKRELEETLALEDVEPERRDIR